MSRGLAFGLRRFRPRGQTDSTCVNVDHQHLTGDPQTFMDYLLTGPDLSTLDLTRDRSPMREVDL